MTVLIFRMDPLLPIFIVVVFLASNKQKTEDVLKTNGRERTTEERLEHFNSRMESMIVLL